MELIRWLFAQAGDASETTGIVAGAVAISVPLTALLTLWWTKGTESYERRMRARKELADAERELLMTNGTIEKLQAKVEELSEEQEREKAEMEAAQQATEQKHQECREELAGLKGELRVITERILNNESEIKQVKKKVQKVEDAQS